MSIAEHLTVDAKNAIEVAERSLHELLSSLIPISYGHTAIIDGIMIALRTLADGQNRVVDVEVEIDILRRKIAADDEASDAELSEKFRPTANPPPSAGTK